MNPAEYSRLARRTEPSSTAYGDTLGRLFAPRENGHTRTEAFLLRLALVTFQRFEWQADQLDRIKKAAFYGKEIPWTPSEQDDGHNVHAPGAASPGELRAMASALPGRGIRVLHAVFGVATEAGELAAGVLKRMMNGERLDEVNIAEEVGDVLWYVAILLDAIGLPWEPVMRANILKLARRFRDRFAGEDAILRDVEAERSVLEEALAGAAVDHADVVGTTAAPARYNRDGERECIDIIRDLLGDEAFVAYCLGQVVRYSYRAGAKDPTPQDLAKADWYRKMALHVQSGGLEPDPRVYRAGFQPYVRRAYPAGMFGLTSREADTGIFGIVLPSDAHEERGA